ncbi:hypothetical protein DFH09DRAFT_1194699 [Mycena vulgaris]|nr:hypothetical protein DFH09DRAFT_1194699 [Mycena vulgaris]
MLMLCRLAPIPLLLTRALSTTTIVLSFPQFFARLPTQSTNLLCPLNNAICITNQNAQHHHAARLYVHSILF